MKHLLKEIRRLFIVSLPWRAIPNARANDMSTRSYYQLIWRIHQADWWRPWQRRADCGCTYAFGKRRLILMDCPDHGWDTWFEGAKEMREQVEAERDNEGDASDGNADR